MKLTSEMKRLFDSGHVPYETICRAVSGDEAALEKTLEHYAPWINKYATVRIQRGTRMIEYIDPVLKMEMSDDFILQILKFRELTE